MGRTPDIEEMADISSDELFERGLSEWPEESERFFEITRKLKKDGEKEKPRVLLNRLAAVQKERGLGLARLDTLLEICRAFPHKSPPQPELEGAFLEAYPEHPTLKMLLPLYFKPKANLVEAAERIRRWLPFRPGDVFFFAGHGAGRVVDIKPGIDAVRLDFGKGKILSLPPGAAAKNLIALPEGDFRREKLEDPGALAERSKANPSDAVRHLIASVGRPLTVTEIKDAFAGVVAPAEWTAFWNNARKHAQLVLTGTGKNAVHSWSGTVEAAHDSIRTEFDAAAPARKLEIAKKHARREELAMHFAETLSRTAESLLSEDPSAAVEIAFFLEEAKNGASAPFSPREILSGPSGSEIARSIADPAARIRAYRQLREIDPAGWARTYAALFAGEEDARALSYLEAALSEGAPQERDALLARVLRSPKTAPRAFLWLCEKRGELSGIAERLRPDLLFALLDALRAEEFSPHRSKVKALFDRGGFALELVGALSGAEEARKTLLAVQRASGLEEFRRDDMKQALQRRFPELKGPRVEPLYATPEALRDKRAELENLFKVEIPKNGKAMQEAAAMGDLRENFEYHAARARAEFLSARAATLREEIARAREIDPARIDPSEVRVGTRIRLAAGPQRRDVTLLGPWESNPEAFVFSYQSDFGQSLLGRRRGDEVDFDAKIWTIEEIWPWK